MAALDRHEKRGVNNLLSFTLNIISKEEPGFSLWEDPGKRPRDFLFSFFPNKQSGLSALAGVSGAGVQRFKDPQVGSIRLPVLAGERGT